jgi:hypothetical protein
MLGMVAGVVLLFDSSDARGGQEPISPWVFVVVSATIVAVLVGAHKVAVGDRSV